MLHGTEKQERIRTAQKRLLQLRNMGFRYVATQDDGDTWQAAKEDGIEIDCLLEIQFLGRVQHPE